MSAPLKEIGETVRRRVTVPSCLSCGCVIDSTGLCSFECAEDGEMVGCRSVYVERAWERVDVLVDQREVKKREVGDG